MNKPVTAIALASSLAPLLAQAHPGAGEGAGLGAALFAGLAHPFAGLDHLAAMLAVGAWTVLCLRHRGNAMWTVPVTFAALLLAGALLGMGGVEVPLAEPMIAASLLAFGLLVAYRVRLALPVGVALAGAFAVFHGVVHGAELSTAWAPAALAGMAAGTLALHLCGMAIGHVMASRERWLPGVAGFAVAALGLRLLAM